MPTKLSTIETAVRLRLNEPVARFWSSAELIEIENAGIKDLWRDIVDLKQEHYLTINSNVTLAANTSTLSGVPTDVHKIYLIEPTDTSINSTNNGLSFAPTDYNSKAFKSSRASDAVDPSNTLIYYAITGQGAPVGPPVIYVAPQVTSAVSINFSYVPSIQTLTADNIIPIPGEADNAIIAWTVAFARAKEREDRAPDTKWLEIYSTEKQHLMQSLGLRQYQDPTYVNALYEEYWG